LRRRSSDEAPSGVGDVVAVGAFDLLDDPVGAKQAQETNLLKLSRARLPAPT
jgi:hypothetical protein